MKKLGSIILKILLWVISAVVMLVNIIPLLSLYFLTLIWAIANIIADKTIGKLIKKDYWKV